MELSIKALLRKIFKNLVDSTLPLGRVEIGMADVSYQDIEPWGALGFTSTGAGSDFLDRLLERASIQSKLLSLNYQNKGGYITVGGIDVKKFAGPLQTAPLIPTSNNADAEFSTNDPNSFFVHRVIVNKLSVTADDGTNTFIWDKKTAPKGKEFILDTGAPNCWIPFNIWSELVRSLHVSANYNKVECSAMEASKGTINFSFGTTTIKVPFKDFFTRIGDSCFLAAKRGRIGILGASFLRSAYLALDYSNHKAYLAQTADCGTETVAIGSGPNAVSDITSLVGKCPAGN
ncbi:peptidase A1family protein [Metarhizium robertsii]|uniref:Peptidase A1family protein n=1 Tax=Metarhizium robertsii TaxID=568076 RepID=A0A0A1UQG7_9HYPO|nr:peptidase A1family protein [Metarhizium robertsii]